MSTPKQLAGYHVRRLRAIRKKLLSMSEDWIDIDEFNISQLAQLADQCEKVAIELVDVPVKEDEE